MTSVYITSVDKQSTTLIIGAIEVFDILCGLVSAFDKSIKTFLAVLSVQFIVKILPMKSSGNNDRFLRFPVCVLRNLPIAQCFIDEELMIEAFDFTHLHVNIIS